MRKTHGKSRTKTHQAWKDMRQRCLNPKNKRYPDYGGRGVLVAERWSEYTTFLADMGEAPDGHSLERIDVDGHYEPGNCKWIPFVEQARNTRRSVYVTVDGRQRLLRDVCKERNISYRTALSRRAAGNDPIYGTHKATA